MAAEVATRRITAYERVLGPIARPLEKLEDEEDVEEVQILEKTKVDIFFDSTLSLINSFGFTFIVYAAVFFNIISLILMTFPSYSAQFGYFLTVLDSFFLAIYTCEALTKIVALGFGYFRSGWNLLDFFILITSCIDFIVNFVPLGGNSSLKILRIFRVLRALRALRMLRAITVLQNLQVIVNTVLKSIGSMAIIFFLMALFLYMFAVMGRQLYADGSQKYFGDLFRATTTMFQLLTFDDWFYIYDDVNKTSNNKHFILFCIVYSLVEYFIFLNLFMAVLVDNFQTQVQRTEATTQPDPELEELKTEEEPNKPVNPDFQKTQWPQGRPTLHYNPYLEDLGHLPLEERILYVQFYNGICSLDYHAYVQKQNFLMMHRLLDKCQDPRLLMNTQAEHE
ncbi:putative Cation channel sperm-associated protein 1 [Hypsibius exemplaris]|uniref:Cation channel sperm-associated protein 1 n=1 Tax=Hypsibius exemplaris TaxID=2072580 RepID=A0A1W0X6J6_HYPEX|nr:putative Cation channel sperm-associated protein 1 [Hypsibius exemplaris]